VQLNLRPKFDLAYALTAQKPLAEIITPTPYHFDLIAGRAGHAGLAGLLLPTLSNWLNELRELGKTYDMVLLDAAAGISPHTLLMCAQSTATLLLTTPDPSSLTDAYALLKLLWQQHTCANAQLIVNQATVREGAVVHKRLSTAATQFLELPPLPLMGSIPSCKYYSQAIKNHQLAFSAFPHSPALQEIRLLAKSL
jgi:flagellar biosynthesis protein FlhG